MKNKYFGMAMLITILALGFILSNCKDEIDDELKVLITLNPISSFPSEYYDECIPATTARLGDTLYAKYKLPSSFIVGGPTIFYQWYKNETGISGATSSSYKPIEIGSYTIAIHYWKNNSLGTVDATSKAVTVTE